MLEGLKNDAKKIAKAAKGLLRFLILFGIVIIFKAIMETLHKPNMLFKRATIFCKSQGNAC